MDLTLTRKIFTSKATTGRLWVGNVPECFTVEDHYPTPYVKTKGKTAIPAGTYKVTIERSPRFSLLAGHDVFLPRLHNVPGFEGILIHAGNTADDTEGCILVGRVLGVDRVDESRLALAALQPKIQAALNRGEPVNITVG